MTTETNFTKKELIAFTPKEALALSIEDQIDWYVLHEEKLKKAEALIKAFAKVKAECMTTINTGAAYSGHPKKEGVTISGHYGELKATVCVTTKSLELSPADAIKKFGLKACLPAINIAHKALAEAVGSVALEAYVTETTGNRKFQKISKL